MDLGESLPMTVVFSTFCAECWAPSSGKTFEKQVFWSSLKWRSLFFHRKRKEPEGITFGKCWDHPNGFLKWIISGFSRIFLILRHTHKSINKCHPEFSLHLKSWICMGHINKNHTSETHLPRHSFDTFAVNWSTHLSWQIHVSHTHCSRKNPIWEKKELHSTASSEARRVSVQVPLTTAPGKRFSSIVNGLSEGKATPTSFDCMSGVSKKTVKLPRDPAGLL